ncbi:MAG: hypothetical protein B7733_21280 [Myxococcales bacterium FL481]|nr:MAG: hypothetical protein B7733_21280 [Myxococcales bacterium FL481]
MTATSQSSGPERALDKLGQAHERLAAGDARLDALIAALDDGLARIDIGLDYMHPRPLAEAVSRDETGKRIIELTYLCYRPVHGRRRLAVRTIKVIESKVALAATAPAQVVALRAAALPLRQAAMEVLGEMLRGLTAEVERLADRLEHQCDTANRLVQGLPERRRQWRTPASARRNAVQPSYPQLSRRRTDPPIRVTRAGY